MEDLEALIKNYTPSEEVVDQLGKLTLIMTVGPSGAGKTTLMRQSSIPLVLGDTTRNKRAEEISGIDYNFIKKDNQLLNDIKNGRFAQIAMSPTGDIYATRASSYPKEGLATFAVLASVIDIFRNLGFKDTKSIFVVPPNFDVWQKRVSSHNLSSDQKKKRSKEACYSLETSLNDEEMVFLLNDDLSVAEEEFNRFSYEDEVPASDKKARKIAYRLLEILSNPV